MNPACRAAEDWRKLRSTSPWQDAGKPPFPDIVPCALALESLFEADAAAVERMARGFGAQCGWLERQSRLALVGEDGWPAADGGFDPILDGELAGNEAGLLIRKVAEGWLLTRIGDRPDPAGAHLSHEQRLAGVDLLPAAGRAFGLSLRYRVYWRYDEDTGWRQFAARFLGVA
jgi:hypothetical protein